MGRLRVKKFPVTQSGFTGLIHGGCSSVVERQIVVLVVAGSNPVIHPTPVTGGVVKNTDSF